jgi:hypothetical protein
MRFYCRLFSKRKSSFTSGPGESSHHVFPEGGGRRERERERERRKGESHITEMSASALQVALENMS